eukprot:1259490-Lingulodinium_polyedra.AAC.1
MTSISAVRGRRRLQGPRPESELPTPRRPERRGQAPTHGGAQGPPASSTACRATGPAAKHSTSTSAS